MKTTVDLSDAIFFNAKQVAQTHKTTLRALIEEGLRRVLSELERDAKPAFKLQNASIRGELLIADPAQWRDLESEHLTQVHAGRAAQ